MGFYTPDMHDQDAQGSEFFKCDFCLSPWAEDRPMVEGHRGSLICAKCLTLAWTEVITNSTGVHLPPEITCTLCLEPRTDLCWHSPARAEAYACRRCVNQSGRILAKDKESGWKIPA